MFADTSAPLLIYPFNIKNKTDEKSVEIMDVIFAGSPRNWVFLGKEVLWLTIYGLVSTKFALSWLLEGSAHFRAAAGGRGPLPNQ